MLLLIIVLGPTASGKTDLGIQLAKKFNGEIISADSRQVYKDLALGTAKVKNKKPKNRTLFQQKMGYCLARNIPHWLIDAADLRKETFSAGKFKKMADLVIKDISSRKKIPIMVGGSMLYLDAVSRGLRFAPKINPKIRQNLNERNLKELQLLLKKIDARAYKKIDLKNPRRVQRAIEVKLETGKSILNFWKAQKKYRILKLGINLDRNKLYQKIDKRVDQRMVQGMLEEVKRLLKAGIPENKLIDLGLEYRYLTQYLVGEIASCEEAVKLLKSAIHRFARRQLAWWRKDKEIIWIESRKEAFDKIKDFLLIKT